MKWIKWLGTPAAALCVAGFNFSCFLDLAIKGNYLGLVSLAVGVWIYHIGMARFKMKEVEAFAAGVRALNHVGKLRDEGKNEEAAELQDKIINVLKTVE